MLSNAQLELEVAQTACKMLSSFRSAKGTRNTSASVFCKISSPFKQTDIVVMGFGSVFLGHSKSVITPSSPAALLQSSSNTWRKHYLLLITAKQLQPFTSWSAHHRLACVRKLACPHLVLVQETPHSWG